MTVKKVLLINPPGKCHLRQDGSLGERKHCTPPLGLAYLAASLLQSSYEVEVLDILAEGYDTHVFNDPFITYGLSVPDSIERVRRCQPDLIGISVLFSNRAKESFELSKALKSEFPDIPIVFGGQHPSALPTNIISNQDVDYVLIGEGDHSLVSLADALNGKMPLSEVPGLYYQEDGQIKNNLGAATPAVKGDGWDYLTLRDTPNPRKLADVPYPAWHLFPMQAYWNSAVRVGGGDIIRERFAVMVSTRGCPWTCFFCTSPLMGGYKGYRKRENEDVVAEIRWLMDTMGVEEIQFLDDNFFVSVPRAKSLLKVLAQEFPDVTFSVPAGTDVNALDFETIDLLAKANFHKVTLAIEAGDPEIQSGLIDKNVKLDRVPDLVNHIRSRGMTTQALFMIGFPDETREQIMKTVNMALSLDVDDFYISVCTPLPGTPLYDMCVERDLLYDDFDVNDLRYSISNIKLPDVTREELEGIRRNIWLQYRESKEKMSESSAQRNPFKSFGGPSEYSYAGWDRPPSEFRSNPEETV